MRRTKLLVMALIVATGCFWSTAASFPAPGDTILFGRHARQPEPFHRMIWEETAACLGADPVRPIESVAWAVADSIITFDGYLAYGISFMPFGRPPRDIIIERSHWHNPGIISHEAIHVLANTYDHTGPEWGCELPSPVALPLRRPGIGVVEEPDEGADA